MPSVSETWFRARTATSKACWAYSAIVKLRNKEEGVKKGEDFRMRSDDVDQKMQNDEQGRTHGRSIVQVELAATRAAVVRLEAELDTIEVARIRSLQKILSSGEHASSVAVLSSTHVRLCYSVSNCDTLFEARVGLSARDSEVVASQGSGPLAQRQGFHSLSSLQKAVHRVFQQLYHGYRSVTHNRTRIRAIARHDAGRARYRGLRYILVGSVSRTCNAAL